MLYLYSYSIVVVIVVVATATASATRSKLHCLPTCEVLAKLRTIQFEQSVNQATLANK